MIRKLTARKEWQFFSVLLKADPLLATGWWIVLILRGVLPVVFAIVTGAIVAPFAHGGSAAVGSLTGPLEILGIVFVLMQILTPIHLAMSSNLGDRTASWLYDRLTEACIRPPGMGHLEDPSLTSDLTVAREFDTGMTGPPLAFSMDFIASGMVELIAGLAASILLFRYSWWAPPVLAGAWLSTQYLLRESAVWWDRNTPEVRAAQRDADYTYKMAVDPAPAKELRLFGLAGWTIARFVERRTRLHALQYDATRLREKPMIWSLLIVLGANVAVFGSMAAAASSGRLPLPELVVFAQAAIGVSLLAFGGFSWALEGAAAPVAAVLRLAPAMAVGGALPSGPRPAAALPAREIRFRDVTFGYPSAGPATNAPGLMRHMTPIESSPPAPVAGPPVLEHFDLTIPAGSSIAIVGQNGAGKTTLAKLLCRLYDPQSGAIEVDGIDLREIDVTAWRQRVTAVFQDFIRLELPLRDNVAPSGGSDEAIRAALEGAGASGLAGLDTILARGYTGGTDLSGGQWQRVALARALCAVTLGAGVVLLDEPTAQLDVRGEAEIFERILAATRQSTTILISHRFSTVRQADRICVLEHGRVVELGTHDELMALGGRYQTMFDLQAQRFNAAEDEEGTAYDVLA